MASGPLAGVRVVDLTAMVMGPYCTQIMADMGADVIKVENPGGGDSMRAWPPLNEGFSENFASLNRNKRSVTLDLKAPADKAKALDLIRSADVVLENNRPGVMKRLGLDYASLAPAQPRLVYCSISAFGQEGPRSAEAGFDLTLHAEQTGTTPLVLGEEETRGDGVVTGPRVLGGGDGAAAVRGRSIPLPMTGATLPVWVVLLDLLAVAAGVAMVTVGRRAARGI